MSGITKRCDWCPDNTCSDYYVIYVFGREKHRICSCCFNHLRKETLEEREREARE